MIKPGFAPAIPLKAQTGAYRMVYEQANIISAVDWDKLNSANYVDNWMNGTVTNSNKHVTDIVDLIFSSDFMMELKAMLTEKQLLSLVLKFPESIDLFNLTEEQQAQIQDFLDV